MRRILIVDDHPIFAEAFAIMATRAGVGCMVDAVNTLAEAEQRILSSRAYSFVFLDFLLPEANGFSALIHLKKLRPDIPVAIISAREDAHTVSMAHAFGAAAYLGKSLSFGDMQGASSQNSRRGVRVSAERAAAHRWRGVYPEEDRTAVAGSISCALCAVQR
ncbi:MAG: response regulator [Caulobacteraceae bacterium]|nr:response regulator [Caulobacteraceae bacterium]